MDIRLYYPKMDNRSDLYVHHICPEMYIFFIKLGALNLAINEYFKLTKAHIKSTITFKVHLMKQFDEN